MPAEQPGKVISPSLKQLLIDASVNTRSAWAVVRNGAVAEFAVTKDDRPALTFVPENNMLTVDTPKARLRLVLDDSISPVIAETAAYRCSPWSQSVYLCIPQEAARMSNRKSLTHLGPWDDGHGELWDIGIGNDSLDACIVVNDVQLQQILKKKEGHYIIDDPDFLDEIVKFSPSRLFRTKFAYIHVKQKIPVQGEHPDGPHTHLLPQIIRNGINFPSPIEPDTIPVIQVDPFGSVVDGNGEYHEWQGFEADEFQLLLKKYEGHGKYLKSKNSLKEKIIQTLEKGDQESMVNTYSSLDREMQDTVRVIVAQIVCDKQTNAKARKNGLSMLAKSRAINYNALREWSKRMAPALLE